MQFTFLKIYQKNYIYCLQTFLSSFKCHFCQPFQVSNLLFFASVFSFIDIITILGTVFFMSNFYLFIYLEKKGQGRGMGKGKPIKLLRFFVIFIYCSYGKFDIFLAVCSSKLIHSEQQKDESGSGFLLRILFTQNIKFPLWLYKISRFATNQTAFVVWEMFCSSKM